MPSATARRRARPGRSRGGAGRSPESSRRPSLERRTDRRLHDGSIVLLLPEPPEPRVPARAAGTVTAHRDVGPTMAVMRADSAASRRSPVLRGLRGLLVGAIAGSLVGCVGAAASGSVGPSAPGPSGGAPSGSPAAAPSASTGAPVTVPATILDPLLDDAASRTGTARDAVTVVEATAETWPTGALGCSSPGVAYTQAIVHGWRVILGAGATRLDYRVSGPGRFRICEGLTGG